MFKPTHLLVSRSQATPVQLINSQKGYFLVTETEFTNHNEPAFELQAKRGIFCKGIPVVGYSLQLLVPNSQSIQGTLKAVVTRDK
jgi:hypothetical protein